MPLPQQRNSNYFFYLKALGALAALAASAAIATGIYLACTSSTTATFAAAAVVSSPSIIPALVIIGVVAALLLFAYCLSQAESPRTRFSNMNDGPSIWFFGWPSRNYSLWYNRNIFSQPSDPRYGNTHGHFGEGPSHTNTHRHP